MKTNAGYQIIQSTKVYDVTYVIGKKENATAPYVTWEYTKKSGYYWGHYFGNYIDALKDMHERAINQIEYIRSMIQQVAFNPKTEGGI